jgi:phospholipase C
MRRRELMSISSAALSTRPWRLVVAVAAGTALLGSSSLAAASDHDDSRTKTPIKHLVVIFQENISFDHYFATYPTAANSSPHEPRFVAHAGTPAVNGLSGALLSANPNSVNPFRFERSHAATCDQDHDYGDEQKAFDSGLMDKFVETLGTGGTDGTLTCSPSDVMGYFDGNTVTALWNYAQHFAMSDNSFGTTFGPSTPGALNLIAGQTHGVDQADSPGNVVAGTVVGDPRPIVDDCSPGGGGQPGQISITGTNVGDLLNTAGLTWGWFQGGFRPTQVVAGKAVCGAVHTGSNGLPKGDYLPHHEPFQYFPQTANPHHMPPSSVAMIGKTDQANHQYDIADFWAALAAGRLPAVSYLKAPAFQDGHAGYSDPLAEQQFLVSTINTLMHSREWEETAVVIAYDDSDGWYDHVMGPIVSTSATSEDFLTGPGSCGAAKAGAFQGRCGYGPRLPLLVVSPFAKENFVDGTLTDQSSILRFIEDNWSLGQLGDQSSDARAGSLFGMFDFRQHRSGRLILDPGTGQPLDDNSR